MTVTIDESRSMVGIQEVARRVNRRPATVRMWERDGLLPERLMPARNSRGWRTWTDEQVEELVRWAAKEMIPGKGLPHYKPTPEQVTMHIEHMRSPDGEDEEGT